MDDFLPPVGERTARRMGYRPDPYDIKDFLYSQKLKVEAHAFIEPSTRVESKLITKVPKIDQLQTSSCTGCATSTLMSAVRKVSLRSALQIYYEARRVIGETDRDEGAYIRDAIKTIATLGAGRQTWWPFDPAKLTVDPIDKVDRDGLRRKIFSYHRLENRADYLACLQAGFPFVIGFSVYDGVMSESTARSGIISWPRSNERLIGGHAVCLWGFDPNFRSSGWAIEARANGYPPELIPEQAYLGRNSWGMWGRGGDFAITAAIIDHPYLSNDAWTIRNS